MKKLLMITLTAILFSGCGGGYAAPSGHWLDGVPQDAQVISSTSKDRFYKYDGCMIHQVYQYEQWNTQTVDCD